MGSENGTPSSITSAPAFSSARTSCSVHSRSGSPAVIYGMNPFRPSDLSSANRLSIRVTHQPHDFCHVFISAAGEIYNNDLALLQLHFLGVRYSMRAFQCRNDSF